MDNDLRRSKKEAAAFSQDIEALSKLIQAKTRAGEEVITYWKIRNSSGQFATGLYLAVQDQYRYNNRSVFGKTGKSWTCKTELYKFIKKAIELNDKNLAPLLKTSEIVEYKTIEFECSSLESAYERAEVELLRAEKLALEKKLAEKEKLLAQKEAQDGTV